jgi:hypothetical protein
MLRVDSDFTVEFLAQPRDRALYDRFMKLIGRKTVKSEKVSAPKVKAASTAKAAAVSTAEPTHDEIAARAYELYLGRGSLDGYSEEDWMLAEAELRRK